MYRKTLPVLLALTVIGTVAAMALKVSASDAKRTDAYTQETASIGDFLQGSAEKTFAQVREIRTFKFPQDHGSHLEFESEWWYFTGNVFGSDKRRYGYQFTIFRRSTGASQAQLESNWASDQIYLAHIGITDAAGNRLLHAEKYGRGALDLSGSQAQPFRVWVEKWQVQGREGACEGCLDLTIEAHSEEFSFHLHLQSEKPVVLQGEAGLSRKSSTTDSASYYYSLTRLATHGEMKINGQSVQVYGFSWMDHEWFSAVLSDDDAGWDWFSLQFENNREMMLFQVRKQDPNMPSFKYGILVSSDGTTEVLRPDEIEFKPQRTWQSDASQAQYPIGWSIMIPSRGLNLIVDAVVDNQERDGSFRYWEGMIDVTVTEGSNRFSGNGYLEMTGY